MDPNTSESSTYQYSPLPSLTSIRLLELQAASTNEISLQLHTCEIEHALPFDALSYTWRDPRSPYIVSRPSERHAYSVASFPATCNGRTIMIRPNLRDALQMLHTTTLTSTERNKQRYIWIDAICINQKDLRERESQVGLMTGVYQRAKSVIAWLGPEDETTANAFTVMDRLSSIPFIPKSPSEVLNSSDSYSFVTMEDFFDPEAQRSKMGIEPLTRQNWLAWSVFLHRPYFKRAWILQEVVLAQSIVVMCGTRTFDWQKFSTTMAFITKTNWMYMLHRHIFKDNIVPKELTMDSTVLSRNLDPGAGAMYLCHIRLATEATGKSFTLSGLLRNRFFEASDPRDRIYAVLGISRKEEKPFSTHGHLMMPDYSISVKSLYTKIMRILIQSYGDLRFLSEKECRRWRNESGLPSWVPDYSAVLIPDPLGRRSKCNWCAHASWEWKMDSRQLEDPLLDVQGVKVGRISAMSNDPLECQDDDRFWASICNVAQGMHPYYKVLPNSDVLDLDDLPNLPTRVEVLWRTLVANTFHEQHPAPEECGEQFLAFVAEILMRIAVDFRNDKSSLKTRVTGKMHRFMYQTFGWSIGDCRAGPWVKLFASEPETSQYGDENMARKMNEMFVHPNNPTPGTMADFAHPKNDFKHACDNSLGTRRLFRTIEGFLGLGPVGTELGDEVWILAGGKTPFVLRDSCHGRKKLVGEAYVLGMMHKEISDFGPELVDIILE